jgi:hypothetical protein
MVMKLEKVVPFGRSLDEYKKMFMLSDEDLKKRIVGVADDPASFNAEISASGKETTEVVSVDPLYAFSAKEIEKQFYSVVDSIIAQIKLTPEDWVWSYHRSPENLKQNRVKVLQVFVSDFEKGKHEGRYVVGELPNLYFFDRNGFDLALCSHFLFLYSDQLSYNLHRESVLEMLRIASEVRIFPLVTLMLKVSPFVQPLIEELKNKGFSVTVEKVDYELQKGGNKMLRIRKGTNYQ